MKRIKLLGPSSKKYELLKQRITRLLELSDHQIPIVEIQDINRIMAENIEVVPTVIYEGDQVFHWTLDTEFDQMKDSFLSDLFSSSGQMRSPDNSSTPT